MRVRSHTQGEAFKLTLDLDTPLITKVGSNYYGSVYTLINCPKAGCDAGKDSISIKVKDGENGTYREIYSINRIRDTKWIKEEFNFTARNTRAYVSKFINYSFLLNLNPFYYIIDSL